MEIIKYDLATHQANKYSLNIHNKQYSVKGFNKEGQTNFNINKKTVKYDDIIYYDIETVKIGQKFDNESFINLNLTHNILYSFSLLIPKNKEFNKAMEHLQSFYNNDFDEENRRIVDIEEKEEYFLLFVYSENPNNNLFDLVDILTFFRNRSYTVKIAGFNNNKFDDLIFKHLDNYNLIRDEKNKNNKLIIDLDNGKKMKFVLYDLRELSKTFRLTSLKEVGEYIKLPKLEIIDDDFESKTFKELAEQYITYNNRDNEILYYFLKDINEDLGIYETNIARWSRKYFYNRMFEKLGVEYINSNGYINSFNLYGGRTEAYTHKSHNVKYIDFNSLYTSSRVVLDIAKPVVNTKTSRAGITRKRADYFLEKLEFKQRINNLINSFKIHFIENEINDYTYRNLAKIYDEYSKEKFYMLKVKLKGIDELFEENEELIKFYFPFVRKEKGKSTFSFKENAIYEIGFYEVIFLTFFDFEVIEAYSINKGEDILKDELESIYYNRQNLKDIKDKKEALEKLKLNSGYGIYATKNRTSEIILDKRIIENLDKFFNRDENTLSREVKEIIDSLDDRIYFSWGLDKFKVKIIGNDYFKINDDLGKKWTDNSIPILALNIVSNSRFMLYSLILDYIMNSEDLKIKVHYCDTDSLFCDEDIYNRLKELNYIGNDLGQLKDELPENKIEELKCFAPKTYTYKLDNGEEKKIFKGTGTSERKTIITQSLKTKFNSFERVALRAEAEQKRLLKGNLFLNEFGVSEDLKIVWEEQLRKTDEERAELARERTELAEKKGE